MRAVPIFAWVISSLVVIAVLMSWPFRFPAYFGANAIETCINYWNFSQTRNEWIVVILGGFVFQKLCAAVCPRE